MKLEQTYSGAYPTNARRNRLREEKEEFEWRAIDLYDGLRLPPVLRIQVALWVTERPWCQDEVTRVLRAHPMVKAVTVVLTLRTARPIADQSTRTYSKRRRLAIRSKNVYDVSFICGLLPPFHSDRAQSVHGLLINRRGLERIETSCGAVREALAQKVDKETPTDDASRSSPIYIKWICQLSIVPQPATRYRDANPYSLTGLIGDCGDCRLCTTPRPAVVNGEMYTFSSMLVEIAHLNAASELIDEAPSG